MHPNHRDRGDEVGPNDPPFLFCILLAARHAGDRMLESLARDWLADVGIRVVFDDGYTRTIRGVTS